MHMENEKEKKGKMEKDHFIAALTYKILKAKPISFHCHSSSKTPQSCNSSLAPQTPSPIDIENSKCTTHLCVGKFHQDLLSIISKRPTPKSPRSLVDHLLNPWRKPFQGPQWERMLVAFNRLEYWHGKGGEVAPTCR